MGGGRQVDLMCIINGNPPTGTKYVEEIPVSEMGGFSCESCGRFYERVPLVGVCSCGGSLAFCHKGGTAKFVVV